MARPFTYTTENCAKLGRGQRFGMGASFTALVDRSRFDSRAQFESWPAVAVATAARHVWEEAGGALREATLGRRGFHEAFTDTGYMVPRLVEQVVAVAAWSRVETTAAGRVVEAVATGSNGAAGSNNVGPSGTSEAAAVRRERDERVAALVGSFRGLSDRLFDRFAPSAQLPASKAPPPLWPAASVDTCDRVAAATSVTGEPQRVRALDVLVALALMCRGTVATKLMLLYSLFSSDCDWAAPQPWLYATRAADCADGARCALKGAELQDLFLSLCTVMRRCGVAPVDVPLSACDTAKLAAALPPTPTLPLVRRAPPRARCFHAHFEAALTEAVVAEAAIETQALASRPSSRSSSRSSSSSSTADSVCPWAGNGDDSELSTVVRANGTGGAALRASAVAKNEAVIALQPSRPPTVNIRAAAPQALDLSQNARLARLRELFGTRLDDDCSTRSAFLLAVKVHEAEAAAAAAPLGLLLPGKVRFRFFRGPPFAVSASSGAPLQADARALRRQSSFSSMSSAALAVGAAMAATRPITPSTAAVGADDKRPRVTDNAATMTAATVATASTDPATYVPSDSEWCAALAAVCLSAPARWRRLGAARRKASLLVPGGRTLRAGPLMADYLVAAHATVLTTAREMALDTRDAAIALSLHAEEMAAIRALAHPAPAGGANASTGAGANVGGGNAGGFAIRRPSMASQAPTWRGSTASLLMLCGGGGGPAGLVSASSGSIGGCSMSGFAGALATRTVTDAQVAAASEIRTARLALAAAHVPASLLLDWVVTHPVPRAMARILGFPMGLVATHDGLEIPVAPAIPRGAERVRAAPPPLARAPRAVLLRRLLDAAGLGLAEARAVLSLRNTCILTAEAFRRALSEIASAAAASRKDAVQVWALQRAREAACGTSTASTLPPQPPPPAEWADMSLAARRALLQRLFDVIEAGSSGACEVAQINAVDAALELAAVMDVAPEEKLRLFFAAHARNGAGDAGEDSCDSEQEFGSGAPASVENTATAGLHALTIAVLRAAALARSADGDRAGALRWRTSLAAAEAASVGGAAAAAVATGAGGDDDGGAAAADLARSDCAFASDIARALNPSGIAMDTNDFLAALREEPLFYECFAAALDLPIGGGSGNLPSLAAPSEADTVLHVAAGGKSCLTEVTETVKGEDFAVVAASGPVFDFAMLQMICEGYSMVGGRSGGGVSIEAKEAGDGASMVGHAVPAAGRSDSVGGFFGGDGGALEPATDALLRLLQSPAATAHRSAALCHMEVWNTHHASEAVDVGLRCDDNVGVDECDEYDELGSDGSGGVERGSTSAAGGGSSGDSGSTRASSILKRAIDRHNFRRLMRDVWCCPPAALFLSDSIFTFLDTDGSEGIDLRELHAGISGALRGPRDGRASFFFALFDTEGAGHMRSDQVLRMLLAGSGREHVSPRDARAMLSRIDADRSGTVEREEFLAAVEADPTILGALSRIFGARDVDGKAGADGGGGLLAMHASDDEDDDGEVSAASTRGGGGGGGGSGGGGGNVSAAAVKNSAADAESGVSSSSPALLQPHKAHSKQLADSTQPATTSRVVAPTDAAASIPVPEQSRASASGGESGSGGAAAMPVSKARTMHPTTKTTEPRARTPLLMHANESGPRRYYKRDEELASAMAGASAAVSRLVAAREEAVAAKAQLATEARTLMSRTRGVNERHKRGNELERRARQARAVADSAAAATTSALSHPKQLLPSVLPLRSAAQPLHPSATPPRLT